MAALSAASSDADAGKTSCERACELGRMANGDVDIQENGIAGGDLRGFALAPIPPLKYVKPGQIKG